MVATAGVTFSGCNISKGRSHKSTSTSVCHQARSPKVGTRLGIRNWGAKGLPRFIHHTPKRYIECPKSPGRAKPIACASDSPAGAPERIIRLPIFPLNLVAFPATTVPLQIFEARYRVLFSTLLGPNKKGVDEVLIDKESPFLGTRLFGICLSSRNGIGRIGATVEIKQHVAIEDGRLLITNKARERFRILQVVQEKPVLICDVALMSDEEDPKDPKAMELAEEVADLYRSVMQLTKKMGEKTVSAEYLDPEELSTLNASDLSFWVASLFDKNVQEQQMILEESSICKRLEREQVILKNAEQFLSAKSAVDSAFTSTPDSDAPPADKA